MTNVFEWVSHYGYVGIFFLLVVGIVGLPVPDETMLAFAGYLVFRGVLRPIPTVAAALSGSLCGITVSFTLGRTAGFGLLNKYGRRMHLTPERVDRVRRWFMSIGRWTLVIGYFVPGVRHLIAVVAGAMRMRYPVFALFAYTGGLCWSLTFISVGFYFGPHWSTVLAGIQNHVEEVVVIAAVLLLAYLIFRWRQQARRKSKTASSDPSSGGPPL